VREPVTLPPEMASKKLKKMDKLEMAKENMRGLV